MFSNLDKTKSYCESHAHTHTLPQRQHLSQPRPQQLVEIAFHYFPLEMELFH